MQSWLPCGIQQERPCCIRAYRNSRASSERVPCAPSSRAIRRLRRKWRSPGAQRATSPSHGSSSPWASVPVRSQKQLYAPTHRTSHAHTLLYVYYHRQTLINTPRRTAHREDGRGDSLRGCIMAAANRWGELGTAIAHGVPGRSRAQERPRRCSPGTLTN